jgi:hypothetical protein
MVFLVKHNMNVPDFIKRSVGNQNKCGREEIVWQIVLVWPITNKNNLLSSI